MTQNMKNKRVKKFLFFISLFISVSCDERKPPFFSCFIPEPECKKNLSTPQGISVLWKFKTSFVRMNNIAHADLDGDGKIEVTAEGVDAFYVLNGEDGSVLWSYTSKEGVDFFGIELHGCYFPLISDIDCDGKNEILAGCVNGCYVLNGEDGSVRKKISFCGVAIGDINGDGRYDVVGVRRKDKESRISAVDIEKGSLLWISEPFPFFFTGFLSIADLNRDGKIDVVGGCGASEDPCGVVTINGRDGSLLWSYLYPENNIGGVIWSPIIIEINGDDTLDVIAGDISGNIFALNGKDGSLLWKYIEKEVLSLHSTPILAIGKAKDGYRIMRAGGLILNERGEVVCKGEGGETPLIGDVDGDGEIEAVIVLQNRKTGNYGLYALEINDCSYKLLYPVEERIWNFILADVNKDCVLDIVYSTESELTALSLGVPVPPPHLLPWPMARHDVKGTSLYTGDPYPPW